MMHMRATLILDDALLEKVRRLTGLAENLCGSCRLACAHRAGERAAPGIARRERQARPVAATASARRRDQILAAAHAAGVPLWTHDRRLRACAAGLRLRVSSR